MLSNIDATKEDFKKDCEQAKLNEFGLKLLVKYDIIVNDKVKVNDFKVLNNNASDHLPLILDFEI